jgi:hypothetical protein
MRGRQFNVASCDCEGGDSAVCIDRGHALFVPLSKLMEAYGLPFAKMPLAG